MLNIKKGETEKACFFLGSQMLVAKPNSSDANGRMNFYVLVKYFGDAVRIPIVSSASMQWKELRCPLR